MCKSKKKRGSSREGGVCLQIERQEPATRSTGLEPSEGGAIEIHELVAVSYLKTRSSLPLKSPPGVNGQVMTIGGENVCPSGPRSTACPMTENCRPPAPIAGGCKHAFSTRCFESIARCAMIPSRWRVDGKLHGRSRQLVRWGKKRGKVPVKTVPLSPAIEVGRSKTDTDNPVVSEAGQEPAGTSKESLL